VKLTLVYKLFGKRRNVEQNLAGICILAKKNLKAFFDKKNWKFSKQCSLKGLAKNVAIYDVIKLQKTS